MEQQERLLALTAELKKALLHQLFTAGLHGEPQKYTDIGPVPESWEVVELASLFEIKHGFAFEGEFFASDGRYILLTPGHFFEEGGFRDQKDKTKFYTGDFPRSYLLMKGDLLVAMTEQKAGLLGSSIVIPESDKYLHNQRLGLIHKLDDSRLDMLFLYYFFNTADVRKRIAMTASGSKVRHTSPGKIRELKIALPSLDEQRRIVEVFQAVDTKFDMLGRKHAALTALFRTTLHQLMTAQLRVDQLVIEEFDLGSS
jgi:type I restriction enzyme S subunit